MISLKIQELVNHVNAQIVGISAKEYQMRMKPLLNQTTLTELVATIAMSDQKILKERKVNEFTKGIRPDGEIIGNYRSQSYAAYKNRLNPLAGSGKVDLMLTRSFTNKMFLKRSNREYIFGSSDIKAGTLIGKYGLDIMGLNQDWFVKRQSEIYRITLVFLIKRDYRIA